MDNNRGSSGGVIKAIAIILMIVGLIGSAVMGGQFADSFSHGEGGFLYFLVLGLVVSLPALMLYGFGELIENTAETNAHLNEQRRQMEKLEQAIAKLSDNAVPANPDKAKTESRLASGAATQKSTADNAASPTVKTHISTDKEFIESLLEMDSASEMLKRIREKYPEAENSNLQPLMEDLWKMEETEKIYGKATVRARNMIQRFLNAGGKYYFVDRSRDKIFCPKCGREQSSDRKLCFSCGALFQD